MTVAIASVLRSRVEEIVFDVGTAFASDVELALQVEECVVMGISAVDTSVNVIGKLALDDQLAALLFAADDLEVDTVFEVLEIVRVQFWRRHIENFRMNRLDQLLESN